MLPLNESNSLMKHDESLILWKNDMGKVSFSRASYGDSLLQPRHGYKSPPPLRMQRCKLFFRVDRR